MNWLMRIYNQNRKIILIIIIVIIFIIILLKGLNYFAEKQLEEKNKEAENTANEIADVYHRNVSALYGEDEVPSYNAEAYNNTLDSFLTYCLNGDINNAYNLLSDECKAELYPTQKVFEEQYYSNIFGANKTYNYQFWAGRTYQVTISDDILKTGGTGNKTVDYYTLIKDGEDKYKLNINGFIAKGEINATKSENGIDITVQSILQYNNYTIYEVKIKNNTDKTILLDSQTNSNSIYAINNTADSGDVTLRAYTEDLYVNDLIIGQNQENTIRIKFSANYSSTIDISSIVFSDIIMDYDEYRNNKEDYENIRSIRVDL